MTRALGHCFICGEVIFDIVRRHTRGALNGEPAQIGKPHADARRCELVLVSGRRMPITVHEKCVPEFEANLSTHWKTIMRAFKYEDDTRTHRKVKKRRKKAQAAHEEFMNRLVNDVPLGILNVRPVGRVSP